MNLFQALLLGIVEGITEFLPISSTFHLIFSSQILGIPQTDFVKLFEVVIQAGAILSVLTLYTKRVLSDVELIKKVIISFIPTAVVGFVLHKVIKEVFFESNQLMLGAFVGVGILFIGYEYWLQKNKARQPTQTVTALTYPQAFLVGMAQALAVVPGVSRAGAVLLTMMVLGTKRSEAAEYSFILAVPTIAGAAVLDLIKMRAVVAESSSAIPLLLVGLIASFFTALVVLKWLIGYLQTNTLSGFGWYRLVVALGLFLVLGVA